jgi:ribonucleoside-diphosphate reductase beta chain
MVLQAFQEVVHSQAYSYILESICDPQEIHGIYYRFKNNEELLKRCSQMTDLYSLFRNDPNDENLAMMFLASLLLEGILFFNGFYFFYSLAYNERMTKCADEIRLINRKHFTAVVKFPLIAGNSF